MALNDISHTEYINGVQIWSSDNDHCIYFSREKSPIYDGPINTTVLFGKGATQVDGPKNWEPA